MRVLTGPFLTAQVQSKNGAPLAGVTVTPSASVYSDRELTVPVTTLTTDGNGVFTAYAAPGVYTFTVNTTDAAPIEPVEVLSPDQGVARAGLTQAAADARYAPSSPLSWAPPTLSNPTEIAVTTAGVINLTAGQDYVLKLPSGGPLTVNGGLQVVGGRHVVIVGGEIKIPASAPLTGPNYTELRAGLFQGQTGVIHIEGVKCYAESGGIINEGFDFIAPAAIAQLQNIRIEHLTRPDLQHCDFIQPYGGLAELRVDKLTGSSIYQGITLKNDLGVVGGAMLRRINIVGEATAGNFQQYLWQDSSDIPIELYEFYLQQPSFQALVGAVWPNQSGSYPRQSFLQSDGSVAWPPAANIKGEVKPGPPPGGDFVPSTVAGVGYSTPGYERRERIIVSDGTSQVASRSRMQFLGANSVLDDPANDRIVITAQAIGLDMPRTFLGHATSALTGNGGTSSARYTRFLTGGLCSKIGLQIGTQSGNISVAVYRNSGVGTLAVPGARVATTGAVACPASGYQELSLGATVRIYPGDWLAISADNATATFQTYQSSQLTQMAAGVSYLQTSGAHPCPATPASLSAATNGAQVVGVA